MSKIWFITGASRGLGADIAKAALRAGDRVVATSRSAASVEKALGASDSVLALDLDVTRPEQADVAVKAAMARFGRIDVLVNNAAYVLMGALEECSFEEIEAQYATNVLGLIAVTKAVLPVLRKQGSGHVFNISSMAGIRSAPGGSLYCSTKFAVEGLSEGLAAELMPLGIKLTIIEPGAFRTEFLTGASAVFSRDTIDVYATTAAGESRRFTSMLNGTQGGDPAKLAEMIVALSYHQSPPLRFVAGADAVESVEAMLENRSQNLEAWRAKSVSLALDDRTLTAS